MNEEKLKDSNISGIYHVDGAEYNVDEPKLLAFIEQERNAQ